MVLSLIVTGIRSHIESKTRLRPSSLQSMLRLERFLHTIWVLSFAIATTYSCSIADHLYGGVTEESNLWSSIASGWTALLGGHKEPSNAKWSNACEAFADMIGLVVLRAFLTSIGSTPRGMPTRNYIPRLLNITLNLFVVYQAWDCIGDVAVDPDDIADELWLFLSILSTAEVYKFLDARCVYRLPECTYMIIDLLQIYLEFVYAVKVAGDDASTWVLPWNIAQCILEDRS